MYFSHYLLNAPRIFGFTFTFMFWLWDPGDVGR